MVDPSRFRTVVGIVLAAVFLALAAIHVAWALGRGPVSTAAVPEVGGRKAFEPTKAQTVAVALALAAAAAVVLVTSGLAAAWIPALVPKLAPWACGVLGLVFVARAVGEGRLVGFFKSVRGTPFATLDTWLYSPLCAVLGVGALWLAWTAWVPNAR